MSYDDESSSMTIKTDDVGRPWSYLNHDVLSLVMMKLGVVDFVAFNGVCKSWRSVALSNWKRFMVSKPPMLMDISVSFKNKDWQCCLGDYEGRKFKTTLTHPAGMCFLGLSCGYFILFKIKTKDFWLVNPITRHELFFPPAPWVSDYVSGVTSVLVFSHSISKLVFVMLAKEQIWFSIADEGAWNRVSTFDFKFYQDLHVFKGKIYTLNSNNYHLCELTLNPEPKVTLLKTKHLVLDKVLFFPQLGSCGENLYMMDCSIRDDVINVYKLDFGEMEWVPFQDTGEEHGFFVSYVFDHVDAVKPELWADPWSHYPRYDVGNGGGHVYLIGRHSEVDMTRRVTRNQNDDDASNSKTIKTDDVGPWLYLNHDLLSIVMMQLGVIDFLAFSGACKSWRSVALSNRKRFMVSKPPMLMWIPSRGINKDKKFCLKDHERRKFKTTLTHSAGMYCCGFTGGYLILFRIKTKDFWLVNPITRHELFFPPAPWVSDYVSGVTSVLVFSPSISKLVFVMLAKKQIWFSIEDEGTWNCVSSTFDFTYYKDLHVFKGKIYTLNAYNYHLCELTLNPEPRVTLLETKILLDEPEHEPDIFFPQLVSCGENLYVTESSTYADVIKFYKLDFGEMEWVPFQDTGDQCGFFISQAGHSAAVKPELWAEPWSQYPRYDVTNGSGHGRFFPADEWWYFPHECLNVNLLDESS
ncbi:unnamed protein product [Lactuca virosa]|uniref:F-box domain-containing protein n=1 Tax=Lactuca virosa TaxID=75947 RepID=A0AAU9NAB1_9ASTR|nr:unnamed protein product [Lactuca virosa]